VTSLVFALVHYRNAPAIRAAVWRLRAVAVPAGWTVEVIVADNSGEAPDDLGAPIIRVGTNLGYLGGAAQVLDAWRTRHEGGWPDWFVLLNPDVELAPAALLVLSATPLRDDVALVAPAILLGGTVPQNPFLRIRPSRARMRFYTVAYRSAALTRMLDLLLDIKRRVLRTSITLRSEPETIYAPHGSAIFCHRRFFERGGTLAYRAFMYGEEIHLAEQARAVGLSVMFIPAIKVTHAGSSTTGAVESAERREWHRVSAEVLWKDYFR
jgi:GT2 family glycosyltransferase